MPKSDFVVNLECYLWDLVDEGIDAALDRIKNETGATGIIVPVHGPAVRQLRPHPGVLPKVFHSSGASQFQPDPARYVGTRMRPVVDAWLKKANHLKRVAQECHQRGLTIGVRVLTCQNKVLAERYEHAVLRDVFGDSLSWLCPANPDVQEYGRSVLADLTENYPLDFVCLGMIGFPWAAHGRLLEQGHESRGLPRSGLELWLRSLCFCPSCRQLAKRDGLDVDAIAQHVSCILESVFESGTGLDGELPDFLADHAELEPLLLWRRDQVHAWLRSIREVCRPEIGLEHHADWVRSGLDAEASAAFYDQYVLSWDRAAVSDIASMIHGASAQDAARLGMYLSAGEDCPDHDSLVSSVREVAKSGWRAAYISNYGTVPLNRLAWIRDAVRYSRRESR